MKPVSRQARRHLPGRKRSPMISRARLTFAVLVGAAVLTATSCWNPFDPDDGDPTPPPYYQNCDSAYKVIANLQYAYLSRDLDKYMACFRDDFEFHLLATDWADYSIPPDGVVDTYWGLDLEEQFHEAMFSAVNSIELTLWGGYDHPWTGDPTGITREMTRSFTLKVYTDGSGIHGYQATGSAKFVIRPDSTGQYYIWQWWDESET